MASFFETCFEQLTGNRPLSWQCRLYDIWDARKDTPVIDLPTGLGKTMVMAIWLIARAQKLDVPTRLVYVVDRRTVVDQATDLAEMLVQRPITKWMHDAFRGVPPAISTLRGQLADNREWSADPSRPAIIIGTVDLIGSALLFSGYRSSLKRRPLEAGLLGQDSLLVLDEAHLSKPFEELLVGRRRQDRTLERKGIRQFQCGHGSPMGVVRMSATRGTSDGDSPPFTLEFDADGNLSGEDAKDEVISDRFGAKKWLTVTTLGEKDDLNQKLADAAVKITQNPGVRGTRIVVFIRKPEDAKAIAKLIRDHLVESFDESGPKPKKAKSTLLADSVEVLTGTIRGLERDELVKRPVLRRFLDGNEKPFDCPNQRAVFLISTSAGEVGFDLNADHMVSDATTIESLIQRLGRVNRRGLGDAQVHLIVEPPKKDKDGKPGKLEGLELAIRNTIDLLQGVNLDQCPLDLSPQRIAALKSGGWKDRYTDACSPPVQTVELTDILLDNWSMTSITDRMPGRPEVGPWLRGIDEEQAQTTVAWRAEIELLQEHSAEERALEAIFAKHRVRPHESVTVNTRYLVKEFLGKIAKLRDRPPGIMSTLVAVRLSRGQVVRQTLQQLLKDPGILYADSTLILPARFGGLDKRSGMLDVESISIMREEGEPEPDSLDVADHEGYEPTDTTRSRLRVVVKKLEDGSWVAEPLSGGAPIPEDINARLESSYEKTTPLFNALKRVDLRVRLVQPIALDDEDDAVRLLVILAPATKKREREEQLLRKHVVAVRWNARRIANSLRLDRNDPIRVALLFAAKWHDEGKKARVWQVFARNPDPEHGTPLGKMAQPRDPKSLCGYRHEFGSLLRIHHPDRCRTAGCVVPTDHDARELALHLIATHHGAGRPHFEPAVYRDFTTEDRDSIHTAAIRRFARLQRKYGWWHLAWLENLLRCADAMASAQASDDESQDDEPEGADA